MPTLENLLWFGGWIHLGIAAASLPIPRLLDWKGRPAGVDAFTRHLFWVYAGFILLVNTAFGLISIVATQELASGSTLARATCAMIAVYWSARWLIQLFVFDPKPLLTSRIQRLAFHALTLGFTYLAIVYSLAALGLWGRV